MPPPVTLPEHIILIGFMGCGKSTIAKQLGEILHVPVAELDARIEEKAKLSIPEIFATKGQQWFRQLESAVLQELQAPGSKQIISTGGGIIGSRRNRTILKKIGYVIWLKCSAETIHQRTSRTRNRPLLNIENPFEKIQTLLAEREPLYRDAADLTIETENLEPEETAYGIIESARYFWNCK